MIKFFRKVPHFPLIKIRSCDNRNCGKCGSFPLYRIDWGITWGLNQSENLEIAISFVSGTCFGPVRQTHICHQRKIRVPQATPRTELEEIFS